MWGNVFEVILLTIGVILRRLPLVISISTRINNRKAETAYFMIVTQIFNIANLFVLPFWVLMIFLPKWKVSQQIMKSYIPFIPLAAAYIYLFIISITPENAQALSNPQLVDIAKFFADEKAAATGWIHFLVMDLFVGRYIYLEGQEKGVWTVHSIALCLFAGPMGLLSHIVTYWITQKASSSDTSIDKDITKSVAGDT